MKYLYRHRQLNDWIPHIWFISGTDGQWGQTPHPISIQAYGRMDSLPPEFLHGLQAQHPSTWPSHRLCLDSLHFVRPICGRIQAIPSGRYVWSLPCLVTNSILFCWLSKSSIDVIKCIFNKCTIKVCVSCCWRCPALSTPKDDTSKPEQRFKAWAKNLCTRQALC